MKILHLYHDLMNLYGDYANVEAMRRLLCDCGEEVTVDKAGIGDEISLDGYDFVFVGSGTERNARVALEDIRRLSDDLCAYIDRGGVALFIGTAYEMLGAAITDADGNTVEGLGLFDFCTIQQNKRRITSDVIARCDFLDRPLVGFVNKCSEITGVTEPLFEIIYGVGNTDDDRHDGVRRGNLLGTHITGPLLIKNPHMLTYLAGLILGREIHTDALTYQERGYELSLSELQKVARQLS